MFRYLRVEEKKTKLVKDSNINTVEGAILKKLLSDVRHDVDVTSQESSYTSFQ